jgi:phage terminase large subunit-like protein
MMPDEIPPIEFPPGIDPDLSDLRHSAYTLEARGPAPPWGHVGGSDYRRAITADSPLKFAITYFPDWLCQENTWSMSFCRMHLEMCMAAKELIRPGPSRHAWIAPRQAGKSRWWFGILPIWAIAHGHRRYLTAFAYTQHQAANHLANILDRLATPNSLLLADFPELAIARGRGGEGRTMLENGAVLDSKGMQGSSSGKLAPGGRPDLIIGDDVDPDAAKNTPKEAGKNRDRFLKTILPLNYRASVQVTGTVTMYGSFIHDFVHAAKGRPAGDWVKAQRFYVHHYSPIQGDGSLLWPQQWPRGMLHREKAADPESYALNYDNDPVLPSERTFWTEDMFRYNPDFPVARRFLYVDVAVTWKPNSDYTAMVLLAVDPSGQRACVEEVRWGRWQPHETRRNIHELCDTSNRLKPFVRVESNQGGDTWLDSLAPWPLGVRYETRRASPTSKDVRIGWGLTHYRARRVWHAFKDPRVEAELMKYPEAEKDDVADALAGALEMAWPPPETTAA